MKITIASTDVRYSYYFDIPEIIMVFFDKETPKAQVEYIKEKLWELVKVEESLELGLISRIKRYYLLKVRRLKLILNGLLFQAEKDLE